MKKIAVAVGVIERSNGDILIAKRHQHLHQGGKWEFPGGKVEAGESTLSALSRELIEEVSLTVIDATPFMLIEHDYGDKVVRLDILHVNSFEGDAHSNEGQEIKWVAKAELANYEFPAANLAIIKQLISNSSATQV